MPNDTNTNVKPILVGNLTLTELEARYSDSSIHDNPREDVQELLTAFEAVCKRLRLEVKRHKKTKKKLAEATEHINLLVKIGDDVEVALGPKRNVLNSLAEDVAQLAKENHDLHEELGQIELREFERRQIRERERHARRLDG